MESSVHNEFLFLQDATKFNSIKTKIYDESQLLAEFEMSHLLLI